MTPNLDPEPISKNPADLRRDLLKYVEHTFGANASARIHRALEWAEEAHRWQLRDDGTPYICHLLRTAISLMREFGLADEDLVCTALLHDTLEDQERLSETSLGEQFGRRVASWVAILTKPVRGSQTRHQINETYFRRIQEAPIECQKIKLLDKLDNVRDATSCPDLDKRRRTGKDVIEFYLPLAWRMSQDEFHARIVQELTTALAHLEATLIPGSLSS